MASPTVLAQIIEQVNAAKAELDRYEPAEVDWYQRALDTANNLTPWLVDEAPALRAYVQDVLNSPQRLRDAWEAIKPQIESRAEAARIDELLTHESVLLEFLAGDTVSVVVTGHLLARNPSGELTGNSKSDYPDIFLRTRDYSMLPVRLRGTKNFGAAVRGKQRRPVRVPDGLEIKTSRNGASIDCHYPHVGLHLMLSFNATSGSVVVDDVLLAFLRRDHYRISERRTEATTVKASFTRAQFISLLRAD